MNGLTRWQKPDLGWPTFGRLSDLRNEIDRLFEAPLAEFVRGSQLLSVWTPPMDVHEDKDSVYVKIEVPGMKREDIQVSLHEGNLSISGERKEESQRKEGEVYRSERFFGRFQRTV